MAAFGPYGGVEEIDFSKFYGKSLFLITGETGAGKTTIFDAICFALYGSTCGQKKETKTLRSSFAKSNQLCFVEFEFEKNGRCYKIIREPEQMVKKASGDGFRQKKHCAQLFLPDGSVKSNLKEIAKLINLIIGFDRVSFNKVAMLPQGQFQKLLSERGEQQLKTFRSIFETQVYEQIANGLFDFKQKIIKNFEVFEQQNLKTVELIVCDDFEFIKLKLNVVNNFNEIVRFLERKNFSDSLSLNNCGIVLQKIENSLQKIEANLQLCKIYLQKKERVEQIQVELKQLEQQKRSNDEINKVEKLIEKIESLKFLKNLFEDLKLEFEGKQIFLQKLNVELSREKLQLINANKNFEKVSVIDQTLTKLQSEINNLNIFEKSMELVERIRAELKTFNERLEKISFELKILKAKSLMCKFKSEIDQNNKLIEGLNLLANCCLKKQKFEKEVQNLNKKYDDLCAKFFEQQAFSLAVGLKQGQPCPVCGSKSHPKKCAGEIGEKVVFQADVQKARADVANCQKSLQNVLNEAGFTMADLNIKFSLGFENLNFDEIKRKIKASCEKSKELKTKFESEVAREFRNLEFNFDVDYESEIEKLNRTCEKILATVSVLKNKETEILNKVPEGLQNLKIISEFKKNRVVKQNILNKKKNDILNTKIEIEKTYDVLKAKIDAAKASCDEALIKKNEASNKFNLGLQRCGFSFDEFVCHLNKFDEIEKFLKIAKQTIGKIDALELEKQTLLSDLKKIEKFDEIKLEKLKLKKAGLKKLIKQKETSLINRLAVNENCLKTLKMAEVEMQNLNENFSAAKMLSEVAKGTRKRAGFERYVLCSFINEVLAFASVHFKKVTSGRYAFTELVFQNLEELNFSVFDVYSGQVRDVSTLSGGETFMASLALCLGLRDVVSGRVGGNVLNTMLIDEGFGTLDEHYLDKVVECLNMLSGVDSLIGIVSHVNLLKHKIGLQIKVRKRFGQEGSFCEVKF